MTIPSIEKLLYRPMQCNQALENCGYHSGVILKRAVEVNAYQSPRIVKQGAAHYFNFARPFLNLKFYVRIQWFHGHIQSPVSVKGNPIMIINPAQVTRHHMANQVAPAYSLIRKVCACGKASTAKQLTQHGKCATCSLASVRDAIMPGDFAKLQHMLGAVKHYPKSKWGWRNYFAAGSGQQHEAMQRLVGAGLATAGREWYDWLPIHDLTTVEVFARIAAAGQAPHWVYAAGMSRFSCCFCIMSNKADLTTAARLNPDLYRRYVELERLTGQVMMMPSKSKGRMTLEQITGISVAVAKCEIARTLCE